MNKSELMALDLRSALLACDCHSLFPDEYRNYAGLCVERLRMHVTKDSIKNLLAKVCLCLPHKPKLVTLLDFNYEAQMLKYNAMRDLNDSSIHYGACINHLLSDKTPRTLKEVSQAGYRAVADKIQHSIVSALCEATTVDSMEYAIPEYHAALTTSRVVAQTKGWIALSHCDLSTIAEGTDARLFKVSVECEEYELKELFCKLWEIPE